MKRRFYMLSPEAGDARLLCVGAHGNLVTARHESPGDGDELIVFVPGTDVTAFLADIGTQRVESLSKAAAFLIEEELAEPPESVHACFGADSGAGGQRLVFVVKPEKMRVWLEALSGYNGRICLVPETAVLSADTPPLHLGERILVWMKDRPIAFDVRWLDDVLHVLGQENTPPQPAKDVLFALAEAAQAKGALTDLRAGKFAPRRAYGKALGALARPAALAASLVLAAGIASAWTTSAAGKLDLYLRADAAERYAAATGGDALPAKIPNAAASPTARSASFRELMAALYETLSKAEGTKLISVTYDADEAGLRATLIYPAFGQDDALKGALEAYGYTVELGAARSESDHVVGDIFVGAAQ